MSVRVSSPPDFLSCKARVLVYPDSRLLSKREAHFYLIAEDKVEIVAGQLNFQGKIDDLVDALSLLASADVKERVIIDDKLYLSWLNRPGDKILVQSKRPLSQQAWIAIFDFKVLVETVSSIAMRENN